MPLIADSSDKLPRRIQAVDRALTEFMNTIRVECDGDARFIDDVAELVSRIRQQLLGEGSNAR